MDRLFRSCVVLVLLFCLIPMSGIQAEQSRSGSLTLHGTIAPRIGIRSDFDSIMIEPLDGQVRVNLVGFRPYSNLKAEMGYEIHLTSHNAMSPDALTGASIPSSFSTGASDFSAIEGNAVIFDSHDMRNGAQYDTAQFHQGNNITIMYDTHGVLQDTLTLTVVID